MGIDGYRIVSAPDHAALPNPLRKEVVIAAGAWLENYGNYPWLLAAPALAFGSTLLAMLFTVFRKGGWAFLMTSLTQTGVIFTAGVSMFPFVMPSSTHPNHSLTLWDASSSHLTLNVMFIAAVVFVPIVVSYTAWNFYKMWRVVTVEEIRDQTHLAY